MFNNSRLKRQNLEYIVECKIKKDMQESKCFHYYISITLQYNTIQISKIAKSTQRSNNDL